MATYDDLIEQWKDDPEFILEGLLVELTEQLCHRMAELKVNRAELARRTGKAPAYISAVLNHTKDNLTLLTVVELATALDLRLSCRFHDARDHIAFSGVRAYLEEKEAVESSSKHQVEFYEISAAKKPKKTEIDYEFSLNIPSVIEHQIAQWPVPAVKKCKPTSVRRLSKAS